VRARAPKGGEHHEEVARDWLATVVPQSAVPSRGRTLPLEGLKVLDLSWVVAGPLIGRTLADFGATVVRVESGMRVETARMMQPFHDGRPDREGSALFGNCNAGKLGMTLDLTTSEGQQVVRDLARWADVVVESFSPGQLAKWGLDEEALRAVNPGLVMLSSSIAGQHGPWSKLAGFGNVGSSLSGFQHLVGWSDRLPMGPFGPYTDYLGPRTALVALLAALRHRARTGDGCYIDVSQVESGVYFLAPQIAHFGFDGTVAERRGNDDARWAPHGVYPVSPDEHGERFVAIAVTDDLQWQRLVAVLGRPDLVREDLATAAGRRAATTELDAAIDAWTTERDGELVERRLQEAGIPAYLALRPEDYPRDAQVVHRQHLVELAHPLHGMTVVEGARVRLDATPGGPRSCAPTLGQHNRRVLESVLGYDEATIERLETRGILR
uniref:CaiB/BaiF CoA transferase family protein n=1 Tax=uncultured Aeromicrobium sp. TaxID=337820 RepID=UPI0025DDB14C